MIPLDDDDERLERIEIERLCKRAGHEELVGRFVRGCYSVDEVVFELLHIVCTEQGKPR